MLWNMAVESAFSHKFSAKNLFPFFHLFFPFFSLFSVLFDLSAASLLFSSRFGFVSIPFIGTHKPKTSPQRWGWRLGFFRKFEPFDGIFLERSWYRLRAWGGKWLGKKKKQKQVHLEAKNGLCNFVFDPPWLLVRSHWGWLVHVHWLPPFFFQKLYLIFFLFCFSFLSFFDFSKNDVLRNRRETNK